MQTEEELAMMPAKRHLLVNGNYARLWAGSGLSFLGDLIFEMTLLVWIATDLGEGTRWSALAVTGMLVASSLPTIFIGPIAGALVDRWPDKRRTMLRAQLISASLILLMIPATGMVQVPFVPDYTFSVTWKLGALFTIVFFASAVAQFLRPANGVLTRDVVPDAERARAAGLGQASSSFAIMIGPALAAPLLFSFGAAWALIINAVSFLVSFFLVRSMRMPATVVDVDEPKTTVSGVLNDVREGFQFFRKSRVLTAITISVSVAMLGFGSLQTLDIFFVTENLNTPASRYGLLSSVQGAAMIAGALIWAYLAGKLDLLRSFAVGLIGIGVVQIVYSQLTSFSAALGVMVLFGLMLPAVNVSIGPIMFRTTPRAYVGRVSALINPLIQIATMTGLFLGGFLYSTVMRDFDLEVRGIQFGPLDTILLGAGILALFAGLFALTIRFPADAEPADLNTPE